MEFEIWIYRAVIGVLAIVLWYVVRKWAQRIDRKFDALIEAVRRIGLKNEKQEGELRLLTQTLKVHDKRLNDHAERIRDIERRNS